MVLPSYTILDEISRLYDFITKSGGKIEWQASGGSDQAHVDKDGIKGLMADKDSTAQDLVAIGLRDAANQIIYNATPGQYGAHQRAPTVQLYHRAGADSEVGVRTRFDRPLSAWVKAQEDWEQLLPPRAQRPEQEQ